MNENFSLRPQVLRPFDEGWEAPDRQEIDAVLELAGINATELCHMTGVKNSRTVRRWKVGQPNIPYAVWAILCYEAGLGEIWNNANQE